MTDKSRDYLNYPTFAPLPIKQRNSDSFLRCPGCGCTHFGFRSSDRLPVCRDCGRIASELIPSVLPSVNESVSFDPTDHIIKDSLMDFKLMPNGTVSLYGLTNEARQETAQWSNITAIAAGMSHVAGLRSDGTVVTSGNNNKKQCDTQNWTDMKAIAAGYWHTVGLRKDGTVCAVGNNGCGQCNIGSWTDIVSISAGNYHTVGLRRDGTVLAVGHNTNRQCNVSGWTQVISIKAEHDCTYGKLIDNSIVSTKEK